MAGANKPKPIEITGGDGNIYVVETWNRGTVADGNVMTDYTIRPICSAIQGGTSGLSAETERAMAAESGISAIVDKHYDEYNTFISNEYNPFVSAVNTSAESLSARLAQEILDREDGDDDLQEQIDTLKAATDVIMVYNTYSDFTSNSSRLTLTDNDVIKVLNDEERQKNQTYYQYDTDTSAWSFLCELDPYYSKSDLEHASGKNINITTDENGIHINTNDNVVFTTVTSNGFSGTNLSGATKHYTIDNLFGSAQSGAEASAYITAHSADFLNSAHSAYGKLTFGTKAYPATSYNYNFTFLAGQGISFTTGNNQVTISAEGTTYSDSTYISTANKTISVKDTLIGSAQSGKRAYNILSGTKISAVGSQFTDTAFGYLSAGFRISAGDNLTISAGANNTIQLNAKPSIDTTFSNIWYEGGAEPLGETGTITGITAKFNNDLDSHNHIVNQSVVFGTSGNEVISGLLIQPADPTEDGNVLTYNSLNNSYTWQPGGTTYTTANENIVINNGLKTIGLASSVSSNDLHLTGTNGVVISLNCNYISGYYAGSTTDFTAKMNWRDLLTLNYVSSCNKLGSDGLPVIRVSACSQIPSISEMVEGIYYLV
jgi:hypothetical protein